MSELGVKIIKVLNAGSAIVLAFAGFWIVISELKNANFNIFGFLYPLFFIFFGFLLISNEIKCGHILSEYGFLKTFLGRGLYYIFLSGQVCYAYYQIAHNHVAGDIYGTVFFILGVFYLLMNFYVIYEEIFFIAKGIIGGYFKIFINPMMNLLIFDIKLLKQYKQFMSQLKNDKNIMMELKTKSEVSFEILNSVEIKPNDTLKFGVLSNQKKIMAKVDIYNRTLQDVMFRVKTTSPNFYVISYEKEKPITTQSSQSILIYMKCDESRLQHRLKDKFQIEIVEKQKYDSATNEDCKWQKFARKHILKVSLIRNDIQFSNQQQRSQILNSNIRSHSLGQTPQLVQSRLTQGSNLANMNNNHNNQQQFQSQNSYNSIQNDEYTNLNLKLKSLKQKYQEQAKLIEQYKYDINELQNEIDRNAFIYDLEKKQEGKDQPDQIIASALRDKTGIPLWELFVAATIALILGAILNKN
ncbi:unnamed protein product [Paramecium sonneborni]|uniref:MSP domain-containing protein n=1 Tax=Paramecium sonneborni TaxID=65129 RepID=A0A8S1P436_9CILI|nr:unnamed protein product [Paramecium sonneborni]